MLWLGCFLMGLGLATKLLYIWPILAVLACYILLYGRSLWQRRWLGLRALRPAWAVGSGEGSGFGVQGSGNLAREALPSRWYGVLGTVAAGVACFCVGAFTFLAYNWQTHGTYLKIRSSFVQTEYGATNTTVLPNLWEELDRFRVVLDGGYFWFQTPSALPHIEPL